MTIPKLIRSGDTVTFRECNLRGTDPLTGYQTTFNPPYVLKYTLVGASQLTVVATVVGNDYLVTLTSTQTALLGVGYYAYSAYVESGSTRVSIKSGTIQVVSNLSSVTTAIDERSTAEKQLEAVNSVIEARLSNGAPVRYLIKNREMWYESLESLYKIRNALRNEVARQLRGGDNYSLITFSNY